jgi:hypothetical protein
MAFFASLFGGPPPVQGDPPPYKRFDRKEFSGSESESDSDNDSMADVPAPPPPRQGKRDRNDRDSDSDDDDVGRENRKEPIFRPSSCVCTQRIAKGAGKEVRPIDMLCGAKAGESKICLDELEPFAKDNEYVAVSIDTSPSQGLLDEWYDEEYDDETLQSKMNEYTQNSIIEIQKEIATQLVFVGWNLAPEIVGLIVIRENSTQWIGPPFTIPGYGDTIEVIIVMERCNQDITVTAKEVYELFVKLASKDHPYLHSDCKLRNLCPLNGLKFIDFGIIVNQQFVEKANATLDESDNKVALMSYSMLLIFTMATNIDTQMNSRISGNQYELMLRDLKRSGYVKVLLDNINDLVAYLGLYESFKMEHSPIGMLLHYTVWPVKPESVNRYVRSTRVSDNNISRAVQERINLFPQVQQLICNHIHGILTGIIASRKYGGSKRKTRRRIKKRGKKGKTRRR